MLQNNQYVWLLEPRRELNCMEVITDNGTDGYVIDYRQGFTSTRNDLVFVSHNRESNTWSETSRIARDN